MLERHDAHASPALAQPLDRLQALGLPPGPHEQVNSVLVHELFKLETWLAQLDCRQLAHAALPAELAAAGQFVPEYDEELPELLLLEHARIVTARERGAQNRLLVARCTMVPSYQGLAGCGHFTSGLRARQSSLLRCQPHHTAIGHARPVQAGIIDRYRSHGACAGQSRRHAAAHGDLHQRACVG